MTDNEKIKEILERGVEKIYPSADALGKLLRSGKRIRLYCGYDPSAPILHIGHAITLRKLAEFQKLGHEVIMLIGDFTGMIGDPTDKTATRTQLTREEVMRNAASYKKLTSVFLRFSGNNAAKIEYNSAWSDTLTFLDLIRLSSHVTVQQMIARDMFQERLRSRKPIYLHEFLYPLAQGYDSVAMDVDLEVGGNDQTFNMLIGRDLMGAIRRKEKFVLTMKLLTDPTGKKMGKTEGNMMRMDDTPRDMFGKVMSWPDEHIALGFELLTDVPIKEIVAMEKRIKTKKINPRDAKIKLAKEIVACFHGAPAAHSAEKEFARVFQKKETPKEMLSVRIAKNPLPILDLLRAARLIQSKSEGQRLVSQRGVKVDGAVIEDWKKTITPKSGMVIQAGKRRFVKIA